MKVLVTGGAGFIGSHIVRRMLDLDHEVVVLDNFSTGRRSNLDAVLSDIDVAEGDVGCLEHVEQAVAGCDAVFHQANATGTLNVLVAARDAGTRRVVMASSSSVYGSVPDLPKRESMPTLPMSPYAVSKLAAESYCRSWFDLYGMETVALRYFNVFGPRQDPLSAYAAVVPRFIAAYKAGDPPVIFGDGKQSRDFTYIDNVVDANLGALESPRAPGRVYNIACNDSVTLNELAEDLRDLMGVDTRPVHAAPRPGEVRHSLASIDAAREDLGYTPTVPLREGLRR